MHIDPFLEKVLVAAALFIGFTYVRRRARRANPEHQVQPILVGIFVVIPALLLLEAEFLPRMGFEQIPALLLKLSLIGLTFFAVGRFIIKPKIEGDVVARE